MKEAVNEMADSRQQVKFTEKQQRNFWKKVQVGTITECWTWTASTVFGYGKFKYGKTMSRAHRISWMMATGSPIPPGIDVLHKCDNPPCVNPAHLWLGTDADNMRDRDRKRRRIPAKGETNGMSKLTGDKVRQIRSLYATGTKTYFQLADQFGVDFTNIYHVVRCNTWRHVV